MAQAIAAAASGQSQPPLQPLQPRLPQQQEGEQEPARQQQQWRREEEPTAQRQQQQQQQGATAAPSAAPAQPAPSDADVLAAGLRLGGDRAALQAALDHSASSGSNYLRPLVRVLAMAGGEGATISDALDAATRHGLGAFGDKSAAQKAGMSKASHTDYIAFIGGVWAAVGIAGSSTACLQF